MKKYACDAKEGAHCTNYHTNQLSSSREGVLLQVSQNTVSIMML